MNNILKLILSSFVLTFALSGWGMDNDSLDGPVLPIDISTLRGNPEVQKYRETVLWWMDGSNGGGPGLMIAAKAMRDHPELFNDDQARGLLEERFQWARRILESRSEFPWCVPEAVLLIKLFPHSLPEMLWIWRTE